MTAIEIIKFILTFLIGAGTGILGWWLTQRIGLVIAHRYRVFEEMTKMVHQYTEMYYIRYISLSERIEGIIKSQDSKASLTDLELSFFRLAQWIHARYKWGSEINSLLLLKNHTGERLLTHIHDKIYGDYFSIQSHFTFIDYHRLAKILESKPEIREFFSEFQQELHKEPLLEKIFENYRRWLYRMNSNDRLLLQRRLECFHKLLLFEINMCFQPWYGEDIARPKIDYRIVREELKELCGDKEITQQDVEKYLTRIEDPLCMTPLFYYLRNQTFRRENQA